MVRLHITISGEDGDAFHPVVPTCASSRGIMAAGEPRAPEELAPTDLLEAVCLMALAPLAQGMSPLGYLPSRVRVHTQPDPASDLLEKVMPLLGISVERTEDPAHFMLAAAALSASLDADELQPIEMPGLMTPKGMTIERVRGCAEAMALFVEAAPWRTLSEEVPWTIKPRPSTRAMRTCVVTGALDEQIGLAFLASMQEFETTVALSALSGVPHRPPGTLWSVMLEAVATAPHADVELWEREGLPTCELPQAHPPDRRATARRGSRRRKGDAPRRPAIPLPMGAMESGRLFRPSPEQLLLMETLLRAFAVCDPDTLRAEEIHVCVETSAGPRELTLRR